MSIDKPLTREEVLQKTKEQWFDEGNAHRKTGRYQEAIAAYDRAIALDPNYALAYNNRGAAYNALKKYLKAIADYDRAIQLDPNNSMAFSNKGAALTLLKTYEEAIQACDRAIQLDPNNSTAFSNKGTALINLQRYAEALVACDKAIELNPKSSFAYTNKGVALANLQRSNRERLRGGVTTQNIQLSPQGARQAWFILSCILLMFLLPFVGFFEWNTIINLPSAEIEAHVDEYLNISPIQSSDLDHPYITGKIVVVDKNERRLADIESSWSLFGIRANQPNEVGTIIWVQCTEQVAGVYMSGAKGYQTTCTVTVIDKAQNLIVGQQSFAGPGPPATKEGDADWHGATPTEDMLSYINGLPRQG